jgi:two-component system, OmpR family, sensor histidine kinase KdpD
VPHTPRSPSPRSHAPSGSPTGGLRWVLGYVVAIAVIALCAQLSVSDALFLHATAFLLVFPLGVLVVTALFGVGSAIVTVVGGGLVFDFLFIPPVRRFAIADMRDAWTLAAMLGVAALAGMVAERLRRQGEHCRRLAEVERQRNAILSALSHDLRTPLAALVGASAALCEEKLAPSDHRAFSRMVADEARRLSRLVGRLLDLAKLEAGGSLNMQEPQPLEEVVGAALSRLEPQLEGRSVVIAMPAGLPSVPFDPLLIEQVIINLVENVIRHAGDRSPVEIGARVDGGSVLVEVGDRGPGVLAGEEERVFDKLQRGQHARRGDGGIGLGLTICRAMVAAHDGQIWLANRDGGGALVSFTLPLRSMHARPIAFSHVQ